MIDIDSESFLAVVIHALLDGRLSRRRRILSTAILPIVGLRLRAGRAAITPSG